MKNNNIITNLEKRLADTKAKQDEAFRKGNFSAVNRLTKVIVSTQLMLERLREGE